MSRSSRWILIHECMWPCRQQEKIWKGCEEQACVFISTWKVDYSSLFRPSKRSTQSTANPRGVCRTKQKWARIHTQCENWHLFLPVYTEPPELLHFPVWTQVFLLMKMRQQQTFPRTAGTHVFRTQVQLLTWILDVLGDVESRSNAAAVCFVSETVGLWDLWVVGE